MTTDFSFQDVHDRNTMIEYYNQGNPVKYIFFRRHTSRKDGAVGKQCYPSGFNINGIFCHTADGILKT